MSASDHPGAGVFISYRRDDAPGQAGRLYDWLSQSFGESRVFMDVDSIDIGVDFVTVLLRSVASCEVMLVLIGPRWMSTSDVSADSRLEDPHDYVRIEVETALERGVPVVPVLVQGARLPPAHLLPESLRPLLRRQALELRDASFRSDAGLLVERLRPVLGEAASAGTRSAIDFPPGGTPEGPMPDSKGRPETSWQAASQRVGRLLFRFEVTLSRSSHIVELQFRDLRANLLRVDGDLIPRADDRITTERWEFSLADGPTVRIGVVELHLGMLKPKWIQLTVDGRTLYRGL